MEITPTNLDIIYRQATLAFQDTIAQMPTWYQDVASPMPSQSRAMDYAWLDRVPQMRRWLGNRQIVQAMAHTRRLVNVPYEQTIELSKWDIKDDMLGVYFQAVRMQAEEAKKWPDSVLAEFIRFAASSTITDQNTGQMTPNLGFDGLPVYSTQHPVLGGVDGAAYSITGSSTQSNLFLNTPLTYDNYVTVRRTMMSWVGADGLPLSIVPDVLMVPPALEQMGKLILEAEYVPSTAGGLAGGVTAGASPTTNTYRNSAKLLVNSQLADKPNNWWLLCTGKSVKPFIWQLRDAPVFTQLVDPQSPQVFMQAKFLYGVEARGAACESVWFLSAAGTSSATTY